MPESETFYWLTPEIESVIVNAITNYTSQDFSTFQSIIVPCDQVSLDMVELGAQVGYWLKASHQFRNFLLHIHDNYIAIELGSYFNLQLKDHRNRPSVTIHQPSIDHIILPDGNFLRRVQSDGVQYWHDGNSYLVDDSLTPSRIQPLREVNFNNFSRYQLDRSHRSGNTTAISHLGSIRHVLYYTVDQIGAFYTRNGSSQVMPQWTYDFAIQSDRADRGPRFRRDQQNIFGGNTVNGNVWILLAENIQSQQGITQALQELLRNVWGRICDLYDTNRPTIWRIFTQGLYTRVSGEKLFITWQWSESETPRVTQDLQPTTAFRDAFIPLTIETSPFYTDISPSFANLYVIAAPTARANLLYELSLSNDHNNYDQPLTRVLTEATSLLSQLEGITTPCKIEDRTFGLEIEVINLGTIEAAQALRNYGLYAEAEPYNHDVRSWWRCVPDSSLLASRGPIRISPDVEQEPDDEEIACGPNSNQPPLHDDCGRCEDEEVCENPECIRCNEERTSEPGDDTAEVVSPILQYGNAHHWRQVQTVVDALNASSAQVNRRCGFHVHVDISDLTKQQIAQLIQAYSELSWLFDQLLDRSRLNNFNCRHLSTDQLNEIYSSLVNYGRIPEDRDRYRYTSINISAFPRQGTIEFRQHQGTLNLTKIQNWIRLCVGLVDAIAQQSITTQPQSHNEEENVLALLNQMVDGPTSLWFLQRRQQLNTVQRLQQTTLLGTQALRAEQSQIHDEETLDELIEFDEGDSNTTEGDSWPTLSRRINIPTHSNMSTSDTPTFNWHLAPDQT